MAEKDPEFPLDWRGNEIGVFTKVVWRTGAYKNASWHIGRVVEVTQLTNRSRWDDGWRLKIKWDDTGHTSTNIRVSNVMVLLHEEN